MAAIVLSIRPQYTDLILSGEKTVELRRVIPRNLEPGSEIIIYSTSPVKHIVAIAKVERVEHRDLDHLWSAIGGFTGITIDFFYEYFSGKSKGFAVVLNDVKQLNSPISLSDLRRDFGFTPPQSFSYVNRELKSCIDAAA